MNMNRRLYRTSFNILTLLIFSFASGILLECEGYWDPEDRRKIKAVREPEP